MARGWKPTRLRLRRPLLLRRRRLRLRLRLRLLLLLHLLRQLRLRLRLQSQSQSRLRLRTRPKCQAWRPRRSLLPLAVTGALAFGGPVVLTGCVGALFFHPNERTYAKPEKLGLASHDVQFTTEDRSLLDGWWLPADPKAGPPLCTVVHAHGNAANITRHLQAVAWLPPLGVNVLMFDYRGFGLSLGKPSLDGVVADTQAAVRFAQTLPGSTPGRTLLFGQSLGGATAVRAVAELEPGLVQALVVDSGFARYSDVAHHVAQEIKVLQWFAPIVRDTLPGPEDDPVFAMPFVRVPLWIIHGDADRTVAIDQGRSLYAAARGAKTWVPVPGGEHLEALDRPEVRAVFLQAVRGVCAKAPLRRPPAPEGQRVP